MREFLQSFNTREISVAVWFGLAFLWALSKPDIRQAFRGLLGATAKAKILVPAGLMAAYVWAIAWGLHKVGLWNAGLLKDTLFWFLGTALVLFGKSVSAASDPKFFRKVVADCVKLALVLQFVSNTYVFPLWVELLLIPGVTFIAAMGAVAKTQERFAVAARLFTGVLTAVALVVFCFSLAGAWGHRADFSKASTYQAFALPSLLTLGLIPFIFAVCLWSEYESQFVRLSIWLKDKPGFLKAARREVVLSCRLSPYRLRRLVGLFYADLQETASPGEVRRVVRRYAKGSGRRQGADKDEAEEEAAG